MKLAEGSALIEMGETKVICTATLEERVPPFRRGSKKGWVTAEYGMLPRSSAERIPRERGAGGRTQEIQRLIGRALRAVTDMDSMGERSVWIDCDVLQADGGTRTAAITGAYVALAQALEKGRSMGWFEKVPLHEQVAAVSVGRVNGALLLDLNYAEDSAAEVDMNVVMTAGGRFVEVQGTAEKKPFTKKDLDALMKLAAVGIKRLVALQGEALGRAR